jgi:hypothetical protein
MIAPCSHWHSLRTADSVLAVVTPRPMREPSSPEDHSSGLDALKELDPDPRPCLCRERENGRIIPDTNRHMLMRPGQPCCTRTTAATSSGLARTIGLANKLCMAGLLKQPLHGRSRALPVPAGFKQSTAGQLVASPGWIGSSPTTWTIHPVHTQRLLEMMACMYILPLPSH